jgi:hypothetical protein
MQQLNGAAYLGEIVVKRNIAGVVASISLLVTAPLQAQIVMPQSPAAPVTTVPTLPASAPVVQSTLLLRRDTPVHLMVMNEVSTKERSAGYRFKLRVNEPVIVSGVIVVPAGTLAYGEVMSAESSGNVGKSGRLSARLLNIDLDGRAIGISGETTANGKSGTGEVVAAVIGLGLVGLFAKGNNAKIKAGELMTGFTTEDTQFDVNVANPAASPPPVAIIPSLPVAATAAR